MSHVAWVAIFSAVMLLGVAGVLIPVLPGVPFMFLSAIGFVFVDRFVHLLWWELLILGVVALGSVVVDYASGVLGAKYGGANRTAMLAGLGGMILGLIVFPPFGGLIGLFVGVLIAEYLAHREGKRAVRAATGSLIGQVAGMVVNLGLALLFLALFIVFAGW